MNSTVLRFDGGAIPTGGGASSDRAIHHLFLRELTITELGQEVSVYALLDLDRPTLVAPNYEPVSAFTLYDWCSRGDVLQVDVAEALETGTNTYSAFFESANVATNSDGSYIQECVIRVDTKLSGTTPKINTRYIHLSQTLDESTSVAYLCQPTTLNDHIVYGDSLKRIGKVHFLKAVYDSQADVSAPYGFWIVDLEKPNANSPYGYDYAMADEVIEQLSAGEIFVLSSYSTAPSAEEDIFVMCSSQNQSREGHPALRIWFVRMFASNNPEYMYFTTIYTPSRHNSESSETVYPEGRMAILNWRGQHDALSEFHFMPYTELAAVATTGDYDDLSNKPTIPELVQSDWDEESPLSMAYILNKPDLSLKEDVSNKASIVDPASETEYPSSYAVAGFCNALATHFNEKIQRGLNTTQTNSQAYSLVGTLKVTDGNHRGMMGFELFCCKQCASPIRMTATFGYQADNNLTASYSRESARSTDLTRYKLSWRFADDHTTDAPKIEIWLIDTLETGADQRRCGCLVHMVDGVEWVDGDLTTNTLPSGLTDFTPFYT